MIDLKKFILFPVWVWLFGFLAWFSAEIVTTSTVINKIDGGIIFSLPYYIVQVALIADIILRKKLSLWGIVLIGLIYGLLEEVFYIKNPLFLTLLLAFGHSAVTITFPYLLVRFLVPGEKKPFLSKAGYVLIIVFLVTLYILMAGFLPFVYFDSLLLGSALILIFILLLKKFGRGNSSLGIGSGVKIWEKISIVVFATITTLVTHQNYLGMATIFLWLLIRQKTMSKNDIYLATILFLVFHFLASFINKSADPAKIAANYPFALVLGAVLLFLLWRRKKGLNPDSLIFGISRILILI